MELIHAPNDWLNKKVKDFDFEQMNAVEIAQEMVDIMSKNYGLGLSANQVGLDASIFVIQPKEHAELKEPFAVINPEILKVSNETQLGPEGCLSYPGLFINVSRPKELVAKFLDAEAKECILTLRGLDARCFLHEYDHLQGIEFTDRVSKLKLEMAKKKQKKLIQRITNGRTK